MIFLTIKNSLWRLFLLWMSLVSDEYECTLTSVSIAHKTHAAVGWFSFIFQMLVFMLPKNENNSIESEWISLISHQLFFIIFEMVWNSLNNCCLNWNFIAFYVFWYIHLWHIIPLALSRIICRIFREQNIATNADSYSANVSTL